MKACWLSLWLALICNIFVASAGFADDARVLVVVEANDALALRLVAELQALGLRAKRLATRGVTEIDSLWTLAREQQCAALIWIEPQQTGTRLWVLDRVTAKALRRELAPAADPAEHDALIATSAVELLRASLLELKQPSAPPGEVGPSPPIAALTAATSALSVELSTAIVGSPQGPGPLAQLRAGLSLRATRWLYVALAALSPLYPSTLHGQHQQGSADLWSSSLLLTMRVPLRSKERAFIPYIGVGAFGTLLIANGRALPPFESHRETVAAGGPAFEIGARRSLTDHFGLRMDFVVARTLSRLLIHLGGDEVARWGAPFFGASIGVDMFP